MSDLGRDDLPEQEGPGKAGFAPPLDRRLPMPAPLPVRLVSIDDVHMSVPAGAEAKLDAFYVGLLGFAREDDWPTRSRGAEVLPGREKMRAGVPGSAEVEGGERDSASSVEDSASAERATPRERVYVSDNFRLRCHPFEGRPSRDNLRPVGIEVPSLAAAEAKLIDAEIRCMRQQGLLPGQQSLLLQDPAGNWVELIESRAF